MTKNNGITLIALTVTIIVLIILAGVSISMLTGQNGIITQAQRSRTENRAGTVDERIRLWKTEVKTSKTTGVPVDSENEMLQKLLDEDLVEEEEIDRDAKTITIGERVIDYSTTIKIPIYDDGSMNNVAVYIEYEEGMTWREFVESSYNDVLKMYIENSSDGYKLLLGGWILRNESEECRPDGKIEQSTDYFLTPLY